MLPQQAADPRRTRPFPIQPTDDDADDQDARPTNPCIVNPTAEYAAGYFRRTDPMFRDPSWDEDTEIHVAPQRGEASAKVVFSSVFLLSALGLGAFLLMYSSVHGGELQAAHIVAEPVPAAAPLPLESQTATIGASAPQAEMPQALAAVPTAETTPTSGSSPAAATASAAAAAPIATLAPLPTAILAEPAAATQLPATPSPAPIVTPAPVQPARVDAEPAAAKAGDTNPYDDKPVAAPPHPVHAVVSAPAKPPVVIHIEPNPVKNPYEGSEDTAPSSSSGQ
jgi:hypothetical protein